MVINFKSHRNKLDYHRLQDCTDEREMQEWSFPKAWLLKVFEIAPFKGQVLRLSTTGPLPSTYNSIWNKFSYTDGWGVSALTLQLHHEMKAPRLATCHEHLYPTQVVCGIMTLRYCDVLKRYSWLKIHFYFKTKIQEIAKALSPLLIIWFEIMAYMLAIWSQEISTSEETRKALIHQAFQNFSLMTPPGWFLYRSTHIVGNSVP